MISVVLALSALGLVVVFAGVGGSTSSVTRAHAGTLGIDDELNAEQERLISGFAAFELGHPSQQWRPPRGVRDDQRAAQAAGDRALGTGRQQRGYRLPDSDGRPILGRSWRCSGVYGRSDLRLTRILGPARGVGILLPSGGRFVVARYENRPIVTSDARRPLVNGNLAG